jgi:hypothetical protein
MARRTRRYLPLWCALAVGIALGGCTSPEKRPDVQLEELLQLLPGQYDNIAQARSDLQRGVSSPHEALALDIVPIDAPMIGDHVFYMQESEADDPRRVTAQKVLMFAVVKGSIIETVLTLSQPQRWRNGQLNPDLFKGMMTQDVQSSKGCSLRWKRDDERFAGANEPNTCHGPSQGTSGLARIDLRAEAAPEEFALAELAFDSAGRLVRGRQDEPFYRFRKQTKAPSESE